MKKIYLYFFVAILLLHANLSSIAQTYLEEDFETAYSTNSEDVPPIGWTQYIVGDANTLKIWKFNNRGERIVHAPIEGIFATFDSDWWKIIGGVEEDAAIESPVFDIDGAEQLTLTFDHQFRYCCEGDAALVEVFDGFLWRTVFSSTDEHIGYSDNPEESTVVSEKIDISSALAFSEGTAKVRFRYQGYRSYWWMIDNVKVYTPNDFDVALNTVEVNAEQDCYSSQEPIVATITNDGENSLVFAQNPLTITSTITGTKEQSFQTVLNSGVLTVGNSRTVTVTESADFSTYGNYLLETHLNMNIDGNVTNDVVQQTIVHEASERLPLPLLDFPVVENFLVSYPKWSLGEGENQPIPVESNDFEIGFFANDLEHKNGFAATINLYQRNEHHWIVSPKISATAYTQLTFDLALTDYSSMDVAQFGSDDQFQVRISTDCGLSFQPILSYDASSNISAMGQSELIDLSPYAQQDVILAFYVTDGTVSDDEDIDLFVDNISVRNVFPVDLELLEFANEAAIVCNTEYVFDTIVVKNVGREVLSLEDKKATISVEYQYIETGETTVIEDIVLNGAIAANEIKKIAIPKPDWEFTEGNYHIQAYLSIEEDGDAFNDTLHFTKKYTVQSIPLQPLDFEDYNGSNLEVLYEGWAEAKGFEQPSIEGESRWKSNPFFSGEAELFISSNTVHEWMISPLFHATDSTYVSYDINFQNFGPNSEINPVFGSDDVLQISVSEDCGYSFQPIHTYNQSSILNQEQQRETIDLSSFVGKDIRIAFYGSSGMAIDTSVTIVFLDNISINKDINTSISKNFGDFAFNLFPNPNKGRFSLNVPAYNNWIVEIFDLKGQTILRREIKNSSKDTSHEFYISNFSEGVYIVKLIGKNIVKHWKVIKE